MNETEQTKIYYDKTDLKDIPELLPAKVTKIVVKTALEIFKDEAKDKDQKLFYIEFNNAQYDITGNTVFTYFNKAEVPKKSHFGKFIAKYEKLEEGMEVSIIQNDKNFWKILI